MPTLSWLTRERDVKVADAVPYRLLERDDTLSFGDVAASNMLIQGDNLEALKSLLPYYRGRVKCTYIDPPYNTRSAFEHYDDNLEHSEWLAMIWPRLELLRELLADDGSIWVSIDDNEGHYLKVVMDEVFGRDAFVGEVVWRASDNSNNDAKQFSTDHNNIIVFARSSDWKSNRVDRTETQASHYTNIDSDPRGPWFDGNPLGSPSPRPNLTYDLTSPQGHIIKPPKNGWRWSRETMAAKMETGEIRFTADGRGVRRRTYLVDQKGLPPSSLWADLEETGHNRQAKSEQRKLFAASTGMTLFDTPKPERLLERIIHIATNPGDLVLDSFLGSGTTAAVAQKMGRRWIGVEMGEHAVSHCAPRLRKVIEGEQGGISKAVSWQGGGGFGFYRLGPAVFEGDGTISPGIAFAPLAAHVWFSETEAAFVGDAAGPFLGWHAGRGVALLYNGILGDKSVSGGNVLTRRTLAMIREGAGGGAGPITIYGEASRLGPQALKVEGVTFKQTPYDVRAR